MFFSCGTERGEWWDCFYRGPAFPMLARALLLGEADVFSPFFV